MKKSTRRADLRLAVSSWLNHWLAAQRLVRHTLLVWQQHNLTANRACDRFGYRKTMIVSSFAMACFVFLTFFAVNIQMLLVGDLLCGIPWVRFLC